MRAVSAMLFCAVLLSTAPLPGQSPLPVRPGDRVRLTAGQVRGVFTVVSQEERVLVVRESEGATPTHVAVADLERLAVDRGPGSRSRAAWRGALVGFVIGGASGAILGAMDGDDCEGYEFCLVRYSATEKAAMLGVTLGLAGGLVGGVGGALVPGRRWEACELPLRVGVGPSAGGGLGLAASIRF